MSSGCKQPCLGRRCHSWSFPFLTTIGKAHHNSHVLAGVRAREICLLYYRTKIALFFFFFFTGDRDESLQAFACCLWGTCEAETIAVSKRNGIRAADPPSLLLHYSQRALTASASGISFPLHSSTCLQLRIVSFLRNIKL